ncbi:alpha/beta fold hydrolase [Streptomyces griseoviridis]|uniref:Alpha/beta fold hydrolase n=1 Tax=Streptomyces griseoviridis TaxID=45398 RepID=A0A3S9ZNM5_STRGD|nr:alpha/beta fold hydrolase [Streptomyces griseoviridis]AZS89289.1 alpha/beta fold hydrolase [Streptomyces griseoviridis]QCN83869.1 alpha/beta hydrolase [Streptomyces griseoviridis]
MTGQSALLARRAADPVRAAVLFLHGGTDEDRGPSRRWHPAALRMRPFVRAAAAATAGDGVFLGEVRYRVRGWNGASADPLRDTLAALDELARVAGEVPVVLVGHSMGGRAALRAASAPRVRGVLALAPWCPEGEPVEQLRDKDVVVFHGDRDRITDPRASVALVERAVAAGARAEVTLVPGGDHAMLRHSGRWHRAAARAVTGLLSSGAGAA